MRTMHAHAVALDVEWESPVRKKQSRGRLCVAPHRSSSNNQPIHTFQSGMNPSSMDRGDLALVLAIRDQGSLAGAAATLDVVPSVITKRLGALEARLGQRLFERTTRRLSVTAEGEAVCLHARGAARRLRGARKRTRRAAERTGRHDPPGRHLRFRPALARARAGGVPGAPSALQIELQLTEQLPDLGAEGYDGALWLWAVQQAARPTG
jgi:LysR family transcriptional activator of dmlA